MDTYEIKKILMDNLLLQEVYINKGDGNHYQIIAIDDQFSNMSMLQRQKMIYKVLMEYILDGRIHSLSIQVFTLMEWESEREFIQR